MDKQLYKGLFIICGQIFEKKIYIYITLLFLFSEHQTMAKVQKLFKSPSSRPSYLSFILILYSLLLIVGSTVDGFIGLFH